MKRQIKQTSQESTAEQSSFSQAREQAAREFASPEAMLRHDALHTPVPPNIARRLTSSISQLPKPQRSWWQRWLGS